jgi:UTP--glucose-1-phosphate uridylyltransferase
VVLSPRRGGKAPHVDLDPEHYKLVDDFEVRFPAGPPSLVECERFVVEGDVVFGAGVVARGAVVVRADGGQLRIEDGTVLEG